MLQVAPAANGEEEMQLSVSEKSPVAAIETMPIAPSLRLVRVIVLAELVVPTACVPKRKDVGDAAITGGRTLIGMLT
jgi:hypothetical protein